MASTQEWSPSDCSPHLSKWILSKWLLFAGGRNQDRQEAPSGLGVPVSKEEVGALKSGNGKNSVIPRSTQYLETFPHNTHH